jgi:hypothetical protein
VLGLFLAAAVASSAAADTMDQTYSFAFFGSGTAVNELHLFDQFNPRWGTLTGVSLMITGTSFGSYAVSNSDPDPIHLFNPAYRLRVTFSGSGAPDNTTTSPTAFVTTPSIPLSTATPSSYELAGSTTQTFTLTGDGQQLTQLTRDLTSYQTYFTSTSSAVGAGTFNVPLSITSLFAIGTDNGPAMTLNSANLQTVAPITLRYTYTPAVPEPSTYAMAAAGAGLLGLLRWRRAARSAAKA